MWSTSFNKTLVVVPSANAKQQGGKLGDTLLPKSTPIPKPAQEEGEMSGSSSLVTPTQQTAVDCTNVLVRFRVDC
ncbi:hypothetical protein D0Y65_008280 [Glycine soja]|uniref:Uncharacterized protein n=1 Tax=Glycine soja TaxID=3848 RepID=A0A445LHA5_GLYSO|nr:hypothetical protein D0Y65_008280 [Glycine soja]